VSESVKALGQPEQDLEYNHWEILGTYVVGISILSETRVMDESPSYKATQSMVVASNFLLSPQFALNVIKVEFLKKSLAFVHQRRNVYGFIGLKIYYKNHIPYELGKTSVISIIVIFYDDIR